MAIASVGPRTVAANAPARRNLLSIMAFASVAALPFPACAMLISSRTAWDGMMCAYEVAPAASDTFEKGTYGPTVAAVEREAPYPNMSFCVPDRHGYSPDQPVYPDRLHEWDDHMSPPYRDTAAAVRAKYLAWEAAGKRAELDELEMRADELKSGATRRTWPYFAPMHQISRLLCGRWKSYLVRMLGIMRAGSARGRTRLWSHSLQMLDGL